MSTAADMRLPELDRLIADRIIADDHPEIVSVELTATAGNPTYHNRLVVTCADGSTFCVMVSRIEGQGIPRHTEWDLPRQAVNS